MTIVYKVVKNTNDPDVFKSMFAAEIAEYLELAYKIGQITTPMNELAPIFVSETLAEAIDELKHNPSCATAILKCEGNISIHKWEFFSDQYFQKNSINELSEMAKRRQIMRTSKYVFSDFVIPIEVVYKKEDK